MGAQVFQPQVVVAARDQPVHHREMALHVVDLADGFHLDGEFRLAGRRVVQPGVGAFRAACVAAEVVAAIRCEIAGEGIGLAFVDARRQRAIGRAEEQLRVVTAARRHRIGQLAVRRPAQAGDRIAAGGQRPRLTALRGEDPRLRRAAEGADVGDLPAIRRVLRRTGAVHLAHRDDARFQRGIDGCVRRECGRGGKQQDERQADAQDGWHG